MLQVRKLKATLSPKSWNVAATVEHVKFCVYIGIISRSRKASRIEEVQTISDFVRLLTRLTKATVDSFKGCIQEFTSIHTSHPSLCNY